MKLIIIGCPGSGKSTLAKRLNEILNLPILHLDKIYHTGGKSHISREILVEKVDEFVNRHKNWIIDGNYSSTLDQRVNLADTIILLDMSADFCLYNAYKRASESVKNKVHTDDMAEGFDYTITQDFISYIKEFKDETLLEMMIILDRYKNKFLYVLNSQDEVDLLIKAIRSDKNILQPY